MKRAAILTYGLLAYASFTVVLVGLVLFLTDSILPRTMNRGSSLPVIPAILVDLALLALFALQHSGMARRRFKAWITTCIEPAAERSTYVLSSSVVLTVD